jgi:sec-independent protein translocase protein TatC
VSGAVDEDVQRTVANGRAALGDMLSTVQTHLQKVFIVFVIGLMGSIYVLHEFVWDRLNADLLAQAPDATVVAVTPFDVILLQVKIGLVIGVLLSVPPLIYYSRDALRARGFWPSDRVPRWQLALIAIASLLLFTAGIVYGYLLFFPVAFAFLSSNAVQAGFEPTYSIVKWAEFILLLSLSFGLAAQLPLAMSALAYSGIVPYETFRDYWKHAIVVLYAVGALFTPPDPLTQVMWATPLVLLYAVSLQLTKFVVSIKRGSERVGIRGIARRRWNLLAGAAFVAGVAVYAALVAVADGALAPALARVPAAYRPDSVVVRVFGLGAEESAILVGALAGLVAATAVLVYYLNRALDEVAASDSRPAPSSTGDPAEIDLRELDAAGVRAAPPEAFVELSEEEALAIASAALEDDDHEKAQAVLDRFDQAEATAAADSDATEEGAAAATDADESQEGGSVFTRTGAGMLSAFTEDERDEEDIGGYIYDIAFVLDSVTSKAFWLVGTFMVVLAVTFGALYTGGIGFLRDLFLRRLPAGVVAEEVDIVTLHPVEALIFQIKLATIVAAIATLPILLYFAWPALKDRGLARGNRNVLLVWGGSMFAGALAGSVVGFLYVAPTVISYLAADVAQNNMVIAYRISNFGWLVFFTTVGVGLLADIPISMVLFQQGGLVPYRVMRGRWREVTLAVFALVAFLSPRGVFMMFLIGIPVMLMYGLGLAILWLLTLGGRREPRRKDQPAD